MSSAKPTPFENLDPMSHQQTLVCGRIGLFLNAVLNTLLRHWKESKKNQRRNGLHISKKAIWGRGMILLLKEHGYWIVAVIQSLSHAQLFATWGAGALQASLSFTISWILLRLISFESVMPSNHFTLSYPLLLLPSIFPSLRVFPNESAPCLRWPEYWSFSFSISPSNKYLGLISLRIDWLDLLAIQGTLKSLLQHHSLKASVL